MRLAIEIVLGLAVGLASNYFGWRAGVRHAAEQMGDELRDAHDTGVCVGAREGFQAGWEASRKDPTAPLIVESLKVTMTRRDDGTGRVEMERFK